MVLTLRLDGRTLTSSRATLAVVARAAGLPDDAFGSLEDLAAWCQDARRHQGLRLRWVHARHARAALGHPAAVEYWTVRLRDGPPSRLIQAAHRLRAALRQTGPTFWDLLVASLGPDAGPAPRGRADRPDPA